MSWITPVTDRTSTVPPTQYTQTDLNRVGEDVQYLANLLISYGYPVTVSTKTDWAIGNVPRATQMAQYIADLAALKAAFYGTVALPGTMSKIGFADANNIEKLLLEIETNINHMLLSFWGCGEIGCGET